jgi:hypothetical protein
MNASGDIGAWLAGLGGKSWSKMLMALGFMANS